MYILTTGFLFSLLILSVARNIFITWQGPPVVSAKNFSDDSYKIYFARDGRKNHGTVFDIYSVNSDGSSLTFERRESSKTWQDQAYSYGIVESMGHHFGDFESPDKRKKLVVTSMGFLLNFFRMPKLYVQQDEQKKFIAYCFFTEMEWLPDSRRVVFSVGDKVGILDTETGQLAYLADGIGFIKVTQNK